MGFNNFADNIVIAGVGLIGGSIGLALKQSGFRGRIVGLGRRWSTLRDAINVGAIDSASMEYSEALENADMLIICTPVDATLDVIRQSIEHVPQGCVITDVGSTKSFLVREAEKIIPKGVLFIGAHPMAGSHKTGVTSASPSLFNRSVCILTPTESTDPIAIQKVTQLWTTIGARVELLSPEDHDFLIAAASHLPHILACALVRTISKVKRNDKSAIDFTATGFADMTRIALASPNLWKGILLQNADMITTMIDRITQELEVMKKILSQVDERGLIEELEEARKIRDSLMIRQ